jgi:hypothetical protein
MRARHYDPATGRFLQTDPLGIEADHLYAYARNNPLAFADPTGRSPWSLRFDLPDYEPWGSDPLNVFGEQPSTDWWSIGKQVLSGLGQIGLGFVPWVGDVYGTGTDVYDVASPESRWWERLIGGGSLVGNILTAGAFPNGGPIRRGVGEIDDAFEAILRKVDELDFSTPPNRAVFYSGRGEAARATEFAERTGAFTIEMTPGGRFLSENLGGLSRADQDLIWQRASLQFARGASGEVNAFVRGADPLRTFRTIEEPILRANPDVWRYRYHY